MYIFVNGAIYHEPQHAFKHAEKILIPNFYFSAGVKKAMQLAP